MINSNTLDPRQVWAAWKNQEITAGELADWQQRNNYYFNETGGRILARRLFHRLEKGYYRSEYIVLNDGNFYCRIWADTEAEAIRIFETGEYQPC
jgi:hypothetical protein